MKLYHGHKLKIIFKKESFTYLLINSNLLNCHLHKIYDKAKPVVRQGRKTANLIIKIVGLPERYQKPSYLKGNDNSAFLEKYNAE